jgi:NCS1 family nucleobase:cation symporter-1
MATVTQRQSAGLYELTEATRAELVSSKYYNKDLAPTSVSERSWNTFHISMLWVGMSICIPSFMMASGLVGLGVSPWLAVLNVVLGNVLILIPIQLNSHAGTKYGIPFPVFARLTFGSRGAQLPSLSRAITACGWNAVQCGVGATALFFMLKAFVPSFDSSTTAAIWIGFFVFLILTWLVTVFGEKVIRSFESFGSPILIVMSVALFIWAVVLGSSEGVTFGELLTSKLPAGEIDSNGGFMIVYMLGLTNNIGFWATMALNIPDFSRYAKSQKVQFRGQLYGMPLAMAVCAVIGAIYAQATYIAFGKALFSPVEALDHIGTGGGARLVMFVVGFGVVIATLTTNIAANVVAPANGISNISPKRISYAAGTTIACVIAIGYYALNLSGSASGPMFTFLNIYGGILAPIAAIFIADYYIVKRRNIDMMSLYKGPEGRYWYQGGFNVKAIIAWICGSFIPTFYSIVKIPYDNAVASETIAPAFSKAIAENSVLTFINANAYIFAFAIAFVVYILIKGKGDKSNLSDAEEAAITEVV